MSWGCRVYVVCRVYPTESEERVIRAIRNLFPHISLERRGEFITGEGGEADLNNFLQIILRERIAPRTVEVMRERQHGDSVIIPLDRDAAYVGRISFGADGEMSPIWVEIRGNIDEVVDYLGARTDSK